MKRACLLSLAVALTLFAVAMPASAATPEASPALFAPTMSPAVAPPGSALPAWDPALLATPQPAVSLDPLAWAQSPACPQVCAGCPAPCLRSNCHQVGSCLHCC